MLRAKLIRRGFTALAVMLAAASMTGCQGGIALTDAAGRDVRAELRSSRRDVPSFRHRGGLDEKKAEKPRLAKHSGTDERKIEKPRFA